MWGYFGHRHFEKNILDAKKLAFFCTNLWCQKIPLHPKSFLHPK